MFVKIATGLDALVVLTGEEVMQDFADPPNVTWAVPWAVPLSRWLPRPALEMYAIRGPAISAWHGMGIPLDHNQGRLDLKPVGEGLLLNVHAIASAER